MDPTIEPMTDIMTLDAGVAPTVEQGFRKPQAGSSNLSTSSTDLADPDMRTCHLCGLTKAKTVFSKEQDWPTSDQPLCRKCRDDARALVEEETADQKEIAALVAMSHGEEVELFKLKRRQMLQALTPYKIKQASIKDLTIGIKNLHPVEQLIQNKPTSIVGVQDREELLQMAKMIREERERRATIIDVTPKDAQPCQ